MVRYKRDIYDEFKKHVALPEVTVLTGMRRVGKTTLLKQVAEDFKKRQPLFLDLERIDNRELFVEKNYEVIYQVLKSRGFRDGGIVLLDEVQYAPNLPSVVKYLLDHYQIKFVLTGSSSYYLKNRFTESLAGRKKIFELYPLSWREFLRFKGVRSGDWDWRETGWVKAEYERLQGWYEEYIKFGGFPQVVLKDSVEEKMDVLGDIVSSYINIDVRALTDFRDERKLFNLMKLLVTRIGSRVAVTNLSRMSGLSRQTVENYLEFLEKTYVIKLIEVWSSNVVRRIVKAKKLYFVDVGLASYLGEMSSGARFENVVFNQLRGEEVYYWAMKGGEEIDLVVKGEGWEVKERPTMEDLRKVRRLGRVAGLRRVGLIGRYEVKGFEEFVWGGMVVDST